MTDSVFSHRTGHKDHEDNHLEENVAAQDREQKLAAQGILASQTLAALDSITHGESEPESERELERDFSEAPLSELIHYIVEAHHDFIREELPRLHLLAERVIAGRKWHNPEFIEQSRKLRRLSGDLTFHMSHTETVVFPYIESLERESLEHNQENSAAPPPVPEGQTGSLIEQVMVGHSPAGDILRQLEAETRGFVAPENACPDLVALYKGLKELARRRHSHMRLEGYVLYPRALALEKQVLAARTTGF